MKVARFTMGEVDGGGDEDNVESGTIEESVWMTIVWSGCVGDAQR